jgi:hypothetical protein
MTGDMGRMTNEGNFLFMGRIYSSSYQNIRGNRVEPLEISNTILKASKGDIAECAVILKGEDSPFLVAYVAFANDRYIEAQKEFLLRLKVSLMLPSYMRPVMILPVVVLPKTINGKVDTNALRSLSLTDSTRSKSLRFSLPLMRRLLPGSGMRSFLHSFAPPTHHPQLTSSRSVGILSSYSGFSRSCGIYPVVT